MVKNDEKNELQELVRINSKVQVSNVCSVKVPDLIQDCYSFCGGVADKRDHIIGIPNKAGKILDIDVDEQTINIFDGGALIKESKEKKWTGGCLAQDGYIYAFPRGINSLLKIDMSDHKISTLFIEGDFQNEPYYGGVLSDEQIIYQPPRLGRDILAVDLKNYQSHRIPLPRRFRNKSYLYYGGTMDEMGEIYFLPRDEWGRVIRFAPNKEKASFIKSVLHNCAFNSGALAPNGMIYCFATYGNGILKIDPINKRANVIEKHFHGGYFGTKLAFNGKMYGIPGDADEVVEFDPKLEKVTRRIPLPEQHRGIKAKCAGGVIDKQGTIWCIPAQGIHLYKIEFGNVEKIPSKKLYRSQYFRSFY